MHLNVSVMSSIMAVAASTGPSCFRYTFMPGRNYCVGTLDFSVGILWHASKGSSKEKGCSYADVEANAVWPGACDPRLSQNVRQAQSTAREGVPAC